MGFLLTEHFLELKFLFSVDLWIVLGGVEVPIRPVVCPAVLEELQVAGVKVMVFDSVLDEWLDDFRLSV